MNIIIPIYDNTEPLLKIIDKTKISYIINNLNIKENDNLYVLYMDCINNLNIDLIKKELYKYNIHYIKVSNSDRIIKLGLDRIIELDFKNLYIKTLIINCNLFYTKDIVNLFRNINMEYKYMFKFCTNNINNHSNIYGIVNLYEIYKYNKYLTEEGNNSKEYISNYLEDIISYINKDNYEEIILDNKYIYNLENQIYINKYIDNCYAFLFDLDGTLVLTDNIYFNVWKYILCKYNFNLSLDIFKEIIHGNNDDYVIKKLLPNITNLDIKMEISNLKDELFIKNISEIEIISNSIEFIKNIRMNGHKIAIVTNCNRKVAETITNLLFDNNSNKYIDIIITSNDCVRGKPYPDPYLKAINYFNFNSNKCIIFEDSKSGLISAKNCNPKCIIGLTTNYNSDILLETGADICINDYNDIDLNNIINFDNINGYKSYNKSKNYINDLISDIKSSIPNIHEISFDNIKLKGGFISDVLSLKINNKDYVLKLENNQKSFLQEMATKLGLYEREYYFYEKISLHVPVKYSKCLGIVKDKNGNKYGIILKNLFSKNYILNLNLNKSSIDTSLSVIDSLCNLHSTFWNYNFNLYFPELKNHNHSSYNPIWSNFINDRWITFKEKWIQFMSNDIINICEYIISNFNSIQDYLSNGNLTLCHGDVKSPNIFYSEITSNTVKKYKNFIPYFIDWQYISIGKGTQDLIFFLIESFDIDFIETHFKLFIEYYYIKLHEYIPNLNYSKQEYYKDIKYSLFHFPFFVAIWFGTLSNDELIDKNFPFFYIQKLFNFYNLCIKYGILS